MRLLTDISPLSSTSLPSATLSPSERVSRATPPRGFKFIRGTPSSVRFGGEVPHNRGRTYAQKLGLRYEQKVHDVLSAIYGSSFRPAPSILFEDRTGLRRAIPDGILDLDTRVVIVEVKYSHCELAWWQLKKLYLPLVLRLVSKPIHLCEIVHSYDPDVVWPEPHRVTSSLHRLPVGEVGVVQWKL